MQKFLAYVFVCGLLACLLIFHWVPAFLAALLAYVLTNRLHTHLLAWKLKFRINVSNRALTAFSAVLVGAGALIALATLVSAVLSFTDGESLKSVMLMVADTISELKKYLPVELGERLPDSVLELKDLLTAQIREHANFVAGASTHALYSVFITCLGWFVGILAAVGRRAMVVPPEAPIFEATWFSLWGRVVLSFERIAFAQAKIALINALITALYLLVVCRIVGWDIPYSKTLILLTFACGLLPVIGNLISNTIITTLALSLSFHAAVASLGYLILAHKAEYFVSARLQGMEIGARVWEVLIALFSFEYLFGPAGMVAAPVIYAFIKNELLVNGWFNVVRRSETA